MHQQTLTLTLNPHVPTPTYGTRFSPPLFIQNPRLRIPNLRTSCVVRSNNHVPVNNGVEVTVFEDDDCRVFPFGFGGEKAVDVATLGNLCVDVVLSVDKLPPLGFDERKEYMEHLAKTPPDKKYWEAGGNCNMAIAAARLGLRCNTIGHIGNEIYGKFLLDVLRDEGINVIEMRDEDDTIDTSSRSEYETLLCWVLVDPLQRHGFCSRADFSKEPAFAWMKTLSDEVKSNIQKSKVLFCNGYGFDELPAGLISSALEYAVEVNTSIFFDPGPKGKSLAVGTPEEQDALAKLLRFSDVLLLTSEEAESITGLRNPIAAGKEFLSKGVRTKWVIIKMGSKGSVLITKSGISCAPSFKVNVMDTVGCGDSFVAAIAYGYIHNMPLVHTLTIANAVGAATATGCGAGRNVARLQEVVRLIKEANINEDDDFWNKLLDEISNKEDITILSKTTVNGIKNRFFNLVNLQKVVSEVLHKLEAALADGILSS
ncbi:putative fructokinase [Helianthus annuus]|uniref:Fructokinase n=1 Tax=Helianthus annuus TaxID=4232 RepID=A0A251TG73_HELAN|nr:fructokinase-1 [Helianthus annuus]KAF5784969.1 putative fructokinase [Helianthus annuus]KAJ0512589.1 putative fructokinase [Helianthus annuus]KAJ0520161.1 putative fructokinase [Helianthus annuus]KAJ0528714.1 putative fructokinase [Helianthus annuus]KAJ0695625.1 putative fructokinase [Helianthus annuus]